MTSHPTQATGSDPSCPPPAYSEAEGANESGQPPRPNDKPFSYLFYQPKGVKKSGKITDENGDTVYLLKEKMDKLEDLIMRELMTMPLCITRNDMYATRVGNIHWKDEYKKTKLQPFTVWGDSEGRLTWGIRKGIAEKVRFLGELADKKGKFAIPTPSGPREFSWQTKDKGETYLLLDHQQTGTGLDFGKMKPVARYTCFSKVKKHSNLPNSRLDIMPEEMESVPGILDACVMSCFFCEMIKSSKEEDELIFEIIGTVAFGL